MYDKIIFIITIEIVVILVIVVVKEVIDEIWKGIYRYHSSF